MVGEILKKRREELGRDLREISNCLKIRYDYLKALEDGDIEKLPAEVYIRGYIQEYAKILNMDTEAVINAYMQQAAPSPPETKEIPEEKGVQKNRLKITYMLIPLILVMLIMIASFQLSTPKKKSESTLPSAKTQGETAPRIAASELVLEVVATDTTWLLVTIDKADSKEVLMKPGEAVTWHAKKGFFLKIGNAGGIRLVFNGKEISKLGEKGQVVQMNLPGSGI